MGTRLVRLDKEKAQAARMKAGLRQIDLAAALGMSQPWLCHLENGEPTYWTTVIAYAWATGSRPKSIVAAEFAANVPRIPKRRTLKTAA